MRAKKTVMLSGLRVSEEQAKDIERTMKRLEELGFDVPTLRRHFWRDIAEMLDRGDVPAFPLQIMSKQDKDSLDALATSVVRSAQDAADAIRRHFKSEERP